MVPFILLKSFLNNSLLLEPTHEILVLIAYSRIPQINVNADKIQWGWRLNICCESSSISIFCACEMRRLYMIGAISTKIP